MLCRIRLLDEWSCSAHEAGVSRAHFFPAAAGSAASKRRSQRSFHAFPGRHRVHASLSSCKPGCCRRSGRSLGQTPLRVPNVPRAGRLSRGGCVEGRSRRSRVPASCFGRICTSRLNELVRLRIPHPPARAPDRHRASVRSFPGASAAQRFRRAPPAITRTGKDTAVRTFLAEECSRAAQFRRSCRVEDAGCRRSGGGLR